MQIINLRKHYYPQYKTNTFIEVSDEVAEELLLMLRAENNYESKRFYHKAFFSFDSDDGIENDAIGWAQPSPKDYMIELEEQLVYELLLLHLQESFAILTPIHARYLLGMKVKDIATVEGVSPSQVSDTIRGDLKRLRKHFKKQKWI